MAGGSGEKPSNQRFRLRAVWCVGGGTLFPIGKQMRRNFMDGNEAHGLTGNGRRVRGKTQQPTLPIARCVVRGRRDAIPDRKTNATEFHGWKRGTRADRKWPAGQGKNPATNASDCALCGAWAAGRYSRSENKCDGISWMETRHTG